MLKVETLITLLSSPLPVLPDRVIYRISICTCDGGKTCGNLHIVIHLISTLLLLLLSLSVASDSLPPHRLQHARFPCPRVFSNLCWLNRWYHLIISSSVTSLLLLSLSLSQQQGILKWVVSLHQVSKILELQLQQQSFQWIFRVDFL